MKRDTIETYKAIIQLPDYVEYVTADDIGNLIKKFENEPKPEWDLNKIAETINQLLVPFYAWFENQQQEPLHSARIKRYEDIQKQCTALLRLCLSPSNQIPDIIRLDVLRAAAVQENIELFNVNITGDSTLAKKRDDIRNDLSSFNHHDTEILNRYTDSLIYSIYSLKNLRQLSEIMITYCQHSPKIKKASDEARIGLFRGITRLKVDAFAGGAREQFVILVLQLLKKKGVYKGSIPDIDSVKTIIGRGGVTADGWDKTDKV